ASPRAPPPPAPGAAAPARRAPQQLEGHLAIQLGIVGGVHLAHPPPSDQPQHDEAPDLGAALERGMGRAFLADITGWAQGKGPFSVSVPGPWPLRCWGPVAV